MTLQQLTANHYPTLYDICNITDSWIRRSIKEHNDFFSSCSGWVVKHKSKVIGYIILMNHIPYMDIAVHCSVLPEFHGKWMTKKIYKTVFNYIFEELWLPRCTSWLIDGYSNPTFLSRLGFVHEGTTRKGYIKEDRFVNVHNYGMLSEDRRWR